MSVTILYCFLISSVFCRIFLIITESIVLIIMNVNPMQSFMSCLIQSVMKSFLIRKHSVSFYIILLLLFVAPYISLQMFITVSSVLHFSVFLISQRYLLYTVIIPSHFNSQLFIKTYSWLSACLIDLKFWLSDLQTSFYFLRVILWVI